MLRQEDGSRQQNAWPLRGFRRLEVDSWNLNQMNAPTPTPKTAKTAPNPIKQNTNFLKKKKKKKA